ncbi:MAG: hypothetical protein QM689_03945 [Oscillospiraceae bacterium]
MEHKSYNYTALFRRKNWIETELDFDTQPTEDELANRRDENGNLPEGVPFHYRAGEEPLLGFAKPINADELRETKKLFYFRHNPAIFYTARELKRYVLGMRKIFIIWVVATLIIIGETVYFKVL